MSATIPASLIDTILLEDCFEALPRIPDGSVDMVLADLPYGTTQNRWDSVLDLDVLWTHYRRVVKPNGAIVLTAAQPFTSVLVASNLDEFRYEWIWAKTVASGQLNAKRQPLRAHESVLVFYRRPPTYNPQFTEGEPYTKKRSLSGPTYGTQRPSGIVNDGFRYPRSVLEVSNPRIRHGHPTQKPVALFEYLIRTYTNRGEIVLDNTIGAGTTAVAAIRSDRRFIGMEIDPTYHTMAVANVTAERQRNAAT